MSVPEEQLSPNVIPFKGHPVTPPPSPGDDWEWLEHVVERFENA